MTGKDWATLALALVGALTGVSSLAWNISTYMRDRPKLTMSYSHAIAFNFPTIGDAPIVTINAANRSKYPVTVNSVGMQLSNTMQFVFGPNGTQNLPIEVKPGASYQSWAIRDTLIEDLKRQGLGVYITYVWANDAVGNRWKTKVPREWSERLRTAKTW